MMFKSVLRSLLNTKYFYILIISITLMYLSRERRNVHVHSKNEKNKEQYIVVLIIRAVKTSFYKNES